MSALPSSSPPYSAETEPFWAAAAESRLVLPVCDACGQHIWYPRSWCPVCGHSDVTWTEVSGRGTVYACTVIRRGMGAWREAGPYVVAYVELDEGPRILTNVVTDEPEAVAIGQAVTATFAPVDGAVEDAPAQAVLRFEPC